MWEYLKKYQVRVALTKTQKNWHCKVVCQICPLCQYPLMIYVIKFLWVILWTQKCLSFFDFLMNFACLLNLLIWININNDPRNFFGRNSTIPCSFSFLLHGQGFSHVDSSWTTTWTWFWPTLPPHLSSPFLTFNYLFHFHHEWDASKSKTKQLNWYYCW